MRNDGFKPFPRISLDFETQTATSRILSPARHFHFFMTITVTLWHWHILLYLSLIPLSVTFLSLFPFSLFFSLSLPSSASISLSLPIVSPLSLLISLYSFSLPFPCLPFSFPPVSPASVFLFSPSLFPTYLSYLTPSLSPFSRSSLSCCPFSPSVPLSLPPLSLFLLLSLGPLTLSVPSFPFSHLIFSSYLSHFLPLFYFSVLFLPLLSLPFPPTFPILTLSLSLSSFSLFLKSKFNNCFLNPFCTEALFIVKVSKVGDFSRGRPKGSLFNSYYVEMLGRSQLLSLDCSTLPLIHT